MKENRDAPSLLIIDDNEGDIELISKILEGSVDAKNIHASVDGEEALRILQKRNRFANAPDIDVVILDLNIPGMSGYDILRAIKSDERTKVIPVVVLTGSSSEKDILAAYELGANSYVVKPALFKDLSKTVKLIDQYWLKTVTLPTRESKEGAAGSRTPDEEGKT